MPELRLIGAGGKIPKGLCGLAEVAVRLDNGMRLKNRAAAGHPAKPRSNLRQLPGPHPTTASAWTWSPVTSRCATCAWPHQGSLFRGRFPNGFYST